MAKSYVIRKKGTQFFVHDQATGAKIAGCSGHPTYAAAQAHAGAMGTMSASERDFSQGARDKLASKGSALPDGSFPIENAKDLANAIRLAGRAKNPAKARQHIIGRAKVLKLMKMIPAEWMTDKPAAAQESQQIQITAQELLPAMEAVWADNAEGLPQADVVIVRPGESANRRSYPQEAITEAVHAGFWDNTPMFVDHGNKAAPRARSVRDLVARIEPGSTYVGQEGEARGKVTFINPEFAQIAKNAGKALGLSAVHEFLGQRYRGSDGHTHERVQKFVVNHSVDFVAFPAAGGEVSRFLPAMESEGDVDWSRLTDSDWESMPEDLLRSKRPDLLTAAEADDQDEDEPTPEGEPKPEGTKLIALEAVDRYVTDKLELALAAREERETKKEAARTQVTAHVAKAGLKPLAQADIVAQFSGQESYDQTAVQAAIDHEMAKIKEAKGTGPKVSGMGDSTPSASEAPAEAKPWLAFESQVAYVPRTGKKADSADDAGKGMN